MVPQAIKRLVERFWPEIRQRHHVPQLARIERVCDMPVGGAKVSTNFRAYKAVDIQILNTDGTSKNVPIFEQVPLAVSVNPHESGLMLEPRPGMQCIIQYIDGLESMPVITNILPFGQSVSDIRSTDIVLQQSPVSKVVGKNQDWHIETTGTINQTSQQSTVSSLHSVQRYHERNIEVSGHDSIKVDGNSLQELMGSLKILVGEKALINSLDSILLGTKKTFEVKSHSNMQLETLATLHAKAAALAKMEGKTVWLGNSSSNIARILLDLVGIVKDMNNTLSSHDHPANNTPPKQSVDFDNYKSSSDELRSELDPITEK